MTGGSATGFGESSEELLRRCKESDESALRELLRRHERPVYNLLYRMLSSHEDAEEALTDVFVKVWRGAGSFRGAAKFTTWLYRIAGNTARDVLRSRRARPEVTAEDGLLAETDIAASGAVDPARAAVNADEVRRIEAAMQRLSPDDRLLVTLYHVQEQSLEEISGVVGLNRGNLKVKLFRARQKLRAHLGELEREANDEMQRDTTESSRVQPGTAESARG